MKKKAITLFNYSELNEVEQHELLWDHGVMIGDRTDTEHNNIILYQMFSFYVELYYSPDYNVLKRLRSFSRLELLDPYIEQIDISDIGYLFKRNF